MMDGPFYIVDVRSEWLGKPYITVWRPDNAGYAYPLSWAGKYTRAQIDERPRYYHKRRDGHKRTLDRFPVPCAVVDALAIKPAPKIIDGDAGPVVPNLAPIRAALRKARYTPTKESDRASD